MATAKHRLRENPFAPHAPAAPAVFVDRERELDLIFSHLRAAQRGNVAISGPLGIGKTSLLRYASDPQIAPRYGVKPPEYVALYVDVHAIAPFGVTSFWRRIGQLLARSGRTDLVEALEPLAGESAEIAGLEDFLDLLADRRSALLLFLDEFEWVLEAEHGMAESRNFLAQLASLARRTPRTLSLVVATEQPLTEVMRAVDSWRGSPFPTIFSAIELKPLGQPDGERLLHLALGGRDDLLPPDDRKRLYELSGGQPAVLQAVAFAVHEARTHGQRGDALREAAAIAASRAVSTVRLSEPASTQTEAGPGVPQSGVWVEALTGEVFVDGQRVEGLTALEYNLLRLLYSQPGRLYSKDDLIRSVWGLESFDRVDHSRVEKLVSRLRHKIEPVSGRPQYLRTVRGRGYRYVP